MSETQGPKKTETNQDIDLNNWRDKFQEFVQSAGEEIKKTTAIGKKMLSASKSNSSLHDAYERLGVLAESAIKDGTLKWDDNEVKTILSDIEKLREQLSRYEEDVQNIKKQP